MSIYFLAVLVIIFVLTNPVNVLAVSVNISNVPPIISDQPFQFNGEITGAQSGVNYIRANLYQPGTTSYFGLTYNGVDYYSGSDFSGYLPVTIDSSGNWNGQVIAKLDTGSSYYKGPGTYNLKIRRYTSANSYLWSNEATLTVNVNPQSSSTSVPTNVPTATPIPSTASTTTITSNNSSSFNASNLLLAINSDQDLTATVNLSLPSNPNTNYYLKGAFVALNGSNYFGLTKVENAWIKNSASYSSQLPITTDSSGNWNGNIDVMVDSLDSGYVGSGNYVFKVARYNASGSSLAWSNESVVNVNNVFVATEKPSSTTSINSPTPIATSVKLQTNKPFVTSIASKSIPTSGSKMDIELPKELLTSNNKLIGTVAGEATSSLGIPSEVMVNANLNANYFYIVGGLLVLCFGGGIIMFILRKYTKKEYEIPKQ